MSREDYADREEDFLQADYTDVPDYSRPATRREVAELRTLVRALERRLDRETAVVTALSEVLFEMAGAGREELLGRVREALGRQPDPRDKRCPHCHQPVPVRSPRCIYCGEGRAVESLADLLWIALPAK